MVRELPDFVTGLVNIAQRGRSLGIHLILATQRPSGVVSAGHPGQHQPADRAAGHRPGRERRRDRRPGRRLHRQVHPGPRLRAARARLARPVPGRAGRRAAAGRRRRGHRTAVAGAARLAGSRQARASPARRRGSAQDAEITDLKVLVEEIQRAARQLRIPRPHSPWLPPLPPQPAAAATSCRAGCPGSDAAGDELAPARSGSMDLPALQRQQPGRPQPGHLQPPHGGRGAAVRALAAAAHHRRGARAARTAARTCTCTGSTAATARCCRWPSCRTAARWSAAPRPSARPGCSSGWPPS